MIYAYCFRKLVSPYKSICEGNLYHCGLVYIFYPFNVPLLDTRQLLKSLLYRLWNYYFKML
jgi:hypothetical protein